MVRDERHWTRGTWDGHFILISDIFVVIHAIGPEMWMSMSSRCVVCLSKSMYERVTREYRQECAHMGVRCMADGRSFSPLLGWSCPEDSACSV